ncbi:MAG: glycosyltransferase, partial [Clostridia bacterium]|nr:glycosyltransferase [Clostridia bacterium]
MKIAVLIPCYNEAKSITKVVTDYRAALPEAEIYVYDNNSTDGTDELARAAGATVRYEHRQGKGNVIRTMFREIEADAYLMLDGDGTYLPEDAEKMLLPLFSGFDHVIVISVSSGLSGTFNALRLASESYEGLSFTMYDTKTLGAGQGFLVLRALELLEAGRTPDEIVTALDKLRFEDSLAIY